MEMLTDSRKYAEPKWEDPKKLEEKIKHEPSTRCPRMRSYEIFNLSSKGLFIKYSFKNEILEGC